MREIAQELVSDQFAEFSYNSLPMFRWQSSAIMALQEAAEAYLVHLFEDALFLLIKVIYVQFMPKE